MRIQAGRPPPSPHTTPSSSPSYLTRHRSDASTPMATHHRLASHQATVLQCKPPSSHTSTQDTPSTLTQHSTNMPAPAYCNCCHTTRHGRRRTRNSSVHGRAQHGPQPLFPLTPHAFNFIIINYLKTTKKPPRVIPKRALQRPGNAGAQDAVRRGPLYRPSSCVVIPARKWQGRGPV